MSKKLIAVASAAALALAALVGAPASAATFAVAIAESVTGTGSSADPVIINVPTGNVVRGTTVTTDTTAVKFTVTASSATNTTTVTATGGVKLVTEADEALNKAATTGSATLSLIGATPIFYATNTSTNAGTVTIAEGGNTRVVYVKGLSTVGYTLTLTGAASGAIGGSYKMVATVTDSFGNPTSGLTTFVESGSGSVAASPSATVAETATGSGVYNITLATGSISTGGAGLATVALNVDDKQTEVAAFGDASHSATLVINAIDPAAALVTAQAQVAALTTQVAALQAQAADMRTKARSVTKKKYNTLARKWNRANPTDRVALKK